MNKWNISTPDKEKTAEMVKKSKVTIILNLHLNLLSLKISGRLMK